MEKTFFPTWQVLSQAINHKAGMPVGTALGAVSFNCDNLEKSKSLSLLANIESLLGCTAWSSLRKSRVRAIRFGFVLPVTRGVSVLPAADLIFLASIASLHSSSHLLRIKVLIGPQTHSGFSFLGKNKQTNKLFSFSCMISLWF